MKAVDTNVLLRFFIRDDEEQFQKAARFFSECSNEKPAFITSVVLVEFTWTLRTGYKYRREDIAGILTQMLRSGELRIEHFDEVQKATELYQSGEAEGFADAYAGLIALKESCEETVTFDRKAAQLEFYSEI